MLVHAIHEAFEPVLSAGDELELFVAELDALLFGDFNQFFRGLACFCLLDLFRGEIAEIQRCVLSWFDPVG